MGDTANWQAIGPVEKLKADLQGKGLMQVIVAGKKLAMSYQNEKFGVVSGVCNHVGGPLGEGRLEGDYIVCPWHYWKFHRLTGQGEPGYEDDRVPMYDLKTENGVLFINFNAASARRRKPHARHPLSRPVIREKGPLRIAGISTTVMDPQNPRYSTSEQLLVHALEHGQANLGLETRLLRLSELKFRNCEGFYSKAASACTWPCSITQMDPTDQMDQVYEVLVHWADVVLIATPIRWGAASSLYFRMAERLNCVQNQITLKDNILIQNKVAGLIITGGQDNVQAVAGSTLGFLAELGFVFPPFPYIAHSLGWTAENMQRNVRYVAESTELKEGAFALLERAVQMAKSLIAHPQVDEKFVRGGRKARRLEPGFEQLTLTSSEPVTSE